MGREPTCPVCEQAIDRAVVTILHTFRCPHCGELLREQRLGVGLPGAVLIGVFVTFLWGSGRVGVFGYLLVMFLVVPLARGLIHSLIVAIFGYTLEPVAEGGRLPLGEADDSQE